MSYSIVDEHFNFFSSTKPGDWHGSSPRKWATWVSNRLDVVEDRPCINCSSLPTSSISRTELFAIIQNNEVDTLTCCAAILAWGGMNRKHGVMLFSKSRRWIEISETIRRGELSRMDAYKRFAELRAKGEMPGMRPAYFTKLIFFLMPMGLKKGYIMDQWTSASVNLLFSQRLVQTYIQKTVISNGCLKISETVLDKNTENDYEKYCQAVEYLAYKLGGVSPDYAEQMMFSEGRGQGEWRNYLKSKRFS